MGTDSGMDTWVGLGESVGAASVCSEEIKIEEDAKPILLEPAPCKSCDFA